MSYKYKHIRLKMQVSGGICADIRGHPVTVDLDWQKPIPAPGLGAWIL